MASHSFSLNSSSWLWPQRPYVICPCFPLWPHSLSAFLGSLTFSLAGHLAVRQTCQASSSLRAAPGASPELHRLTLVQCHHRSLPWPTLHCPHGPHHCLQWCDSFSCSLPHHPYWPKDSKDSNKARWLKVSFLELVSAAKVLHCPSIPSPCCAISLVSSISFPPRSLPPSAPPVLSL